MDVDPLDEREGRRGTAEIAAIHDPFAGVG